ncbi:hypothetical protein EV363DRAFT_1366647 [Boletus edulis]|nr:hypothetical protein EV363DRAFT_1366647 [Boletus edulis]
MVQPRHTYRNGSRSAHSFRRFASRTASTLSSKLSAAALVPLPLHAIHPIQYCTHTSRRCSPMACASIPDVEWDRPRSCHCFHRRVCSCNHHCEHCQSADRAGFVTCRASTARRTTWVRYFSWKYRTYSALVPCHIANRASTLRRTREPGSCPCPCLSTRPATCE